MELRTLGESGIARDDMACWTEAVLSPAQAPNISNLPPLLQGQA